MIAAGVMPRLQRLMERGAQGTLASTIPTYTPPAWTSAITGVNPGRHGIYGFYEGHAQRERQELMHSGKIRSPSLWEIANAQGASCGIYNVPLTYPPRPLEGWMVSGMLTPGYGEQRRRFTTPGELEEHILRWAPGYVCDVSANWERDWRDDALCDRVVDSLEQRRKVLSHLLEEQPPDLLFAVLEAPDRLQHVYYGYMDPTSSLFSSAAAHRIRSRVHECFGAMDQVVGLVDDYAGSDGGVIVCSDHGFTAWEVSVHTNALLESWGYLRLKPQARAMQTGLARKLVPLARRVLPAKVARQAKAKTFAAIDWERTRAFASPIPQQGVFVNLAGRERLGTVAPEELSATKDDLCRRFEQLRGPDGERVTDVVYRSEDVFSGEALEGAPDILPVLREHRFELDDELFHKTPFTDHRNLPRGVHHPDGVVVVATDGTEQSGDLRASVLDVMPTLLYLAGLELPEGLDGGVMTDAFEPRFLKDRAPRFTPALSSKATEEASPYSAEEEAAIEESLRGLGYL
jgi:predicted AlkP superfamily phosphohydrolase/phosphomutase